MSNRAVVVAHAFAVAILMAVVMVPAETAAAPKSKATSTRSEGPQRGPQLKANTPGAKPAARRRIVEGYSAEFYAGSRIENAGVGHMKSLRKTGDVAKPPPGSARKRLR